MKSLLLDDQTLDQALSGLPHGEEFRFIERLLSLDPGKCGVGEYNVHGDEPFLRGHFPGQPLFPGVLLVEGAAQLAGIVAQSDQTLEPSADLKLSGIRSIKFLGAAGPGDTIRFEATLTGRLGNLVEAQTAAFVNGHLIMRGALTLGSSCNRSELS
jgi:3-hydroxyacyl-[acyl-carrier-protein] dehydratase